jgi:hypothetical protein
MFHNQKSNCVGHAMSFSDAVIFCALIEDVFLVSLPVKIWKSLLPFFILAKCSAHLNILHLITLIVLGEWYEL